MKIFNKIYILIIMLFASSSCEKLVEVPIDKIDSEYISTTEGGLKAAVVGLYNLHRSNYFPSGTETGAQNNNFFYVATDLGHVRAVLDWVYTTERFHAQEGALSYIWPNYYKTIERCNVVIASAANINMDQTKKDVLIAEARAIRAELYLDLLTMYDNIVLKTEPSKAEDIGKVSYKSADSKDVYKVIDNDLDFAIAKLPWTVESGRYGQGVARHIRGKSAMWQKKYQEAADNFDAIINNGTHKLVALDKVFAGDRNHVESLYTFQFNKDLGGPAVTGDNLAGGGWTGLASWFNNRYYELSSGELIPEVKYGGLAFGWCFPNDYLQSLYDKVNDKRYTTYYYSQDYTVNNPAKANFGQPLPKSSIENNFRRYHWSTKKYHDENKPATTTDSYANILYHRFAETLLLSAEAHWRLSGSNTDPLALKYINMIRERAYGNSDNNIKSFNLEIYLEEDAREMALEKTRWFLLKRLGILQERVNKYYTFGSNTGNTIRRQMADKMVRLPIPQSEIDLMGTFPQNTGY